MQSELLRLVDRGLGRRRQVDAHRPAALRHQADPRRPARAHRGDVRRAAATATSTSRCSPTACAPSASRGSRSTSPTATSSTPRRHFSSPTPRATCSTRATWSRAPRPPTSPSILVDARQGVVEQTRRHSYIAALLAIPHVVVAVNKMDLVDFSAERFAEIEADLRGARRRGSACTTCVRSRSPRSAATTSSSAGDAMPWYDGPTLLEHLETSRSRATATSTTGASRCSG